MVGQQIIPAMGDISSSGQGPKLVSFDDHQWKNGRAN
jgi:hypothetical protein